MHNGCTLVYAYGEVRHRGAAGVGAPCAQGGVAVDHGPAANKLVYPSRLACQISYCGPMWGLCLPKCWHVVGWSVTTIDVIYVLSFTFVVGRTTRKSSRKSFYVPFMPCLGYPGRVAVARRTLAAHCNHLRPRVPVNWARGAERQSAPAAERGGSGADLRQQCLGPACNSRGRSRDPFGPEWFDQSGPT